MAIAVACKSSFATKTMNRGYGYFASGHVELVDVEHDCVYATVSGSRRTPYSVTIDWSEADIGRLVVVCSCPHYDGGSFCKHIWATLLRIDKEQIGRDVSLRDCEVIHEYDDEYGDEHDDDDELDDDRDYDGPRLAAGPAIPTDRFGRRPVPRRTLLPRYDRLGLPNHRARSLPP